MFVRMFHLRSLYSNYSTREHRQNSLWSETNRPLWFACQSNCPNWSYHNSGLTMNSNRSSRRPDRNPSTWWRCRRSRCCRSFSMSIPNRNWNPRMMSKSYSSPDRTSTTMCSNNSTGCDFYRLRCLSWSWYRSNRCRQRSYRMSQNTNWH